MTTLDYPVWLRIDYWLNVLFLTLIIRSGTEILGTHPKLYWHDDSRPGTEWARFTTKIMPRNRLYDTLNEEESYRPTRFGATGPECRARCRAGRPRATGIAVRR
jgi:methionine sulfoxide reductase catalytic subunit